MTLHINPQPGDIWQYKNGDMQPVTFLLGEETPDVRVTVDGSRVFVCIGLDFDWQEQVCFAPDQQHNWKRLA